MNRKELLIVHYGTADKDSRQKSLGAIENALEAVFGEYKIQSAFASQFIIERIKIQENVHIYNISEALEEAVACGIRELIIMPTYMLAGIEYQQLLSIAEPYKRQFEKMYICKPMLTDESDCEKIAEVIVKDTKSLDDGETAICFMGHGTVCEANSVYVQIQENLKKKNYVNYYIGTRCAEPKIENIVSALKKKKHRYKKVVLMPLMISLGRHARVDMAGSHSSSWKSMLEAEGYDVVCVLKGLGEITEVWDLFVEQVELAIANIPSFLDMTKSV